MPADPTPNSGDVSRGLRPLAQEGIEAAARALGHASCHYDIRKHHRDYGVHQVQAVIESLRASGWHVEAVRPAPAPPPPPTQAGDTEAPVELNGKDVGLLPCAHCGSDPGYTSTAAMDYADCICGASMSSITQAALIAKWNNRSPAPGMALVPVAPPITDEFARAVYWPLMHGGYLKEGLCANGEAFTAVVSALRQAAGAQGGST